MKHQYGNLLLVYKLLDLDEVEHDHRLELNVHNVLTMR